MAGGDLPCTAIKSAIAVAPCQAAVGRRECKGDSSLAVAYKAVLFRIQEVIETGVAFIVVSRIGSNVLVVVAAERSSRDIGLGKQAHDLDGQRVDVGVA